MDGLDILPIKTARHDVQFMAQRSSLQKAGSVVHKVWDVKCNLSMETHFHDSVFNVIEKGFFSNITFFKSKSWNNRMRKTSKYFYEKGPVNCKDN